MIPHVIIRNLAIPLAAGIHYLNIITRRRLEPIYAIACNILYTFTIISVPLAIGGRNIMDFLQVDGWRSPWCAVEYLVFASIIVAVATHKQHSSSFAFTLAVFAAGCAGYLYEVPLWWRAEGAMGLLRTAANSWSTVDWGMLSVPLFLWVVECAGIQPKKPTITGAAVYLSYLGLWELYLRTAVKLAAIYMVPSSFFYRLPAFALVLGLVLDLQVSRFAWCSRGEALQDHRREKQ